MDRVPPVLAAQPQDRAEARDKRGGEYVDGVHLRYEGGQARSLLSLLSYLGSGEYRDRYLGVRIPPTNIREYHLETARRFADGLADRLRGADGPHV